MATRLAKEALLRVPGAAGWNASRHGHRTGNMFDPTEVYSLFDGHVKRLQSVRESVQGWTGLELGPGNSLAQSVLWSLLGAEKIFAVDVQRYATAESSPGVYQAIVAGIEDEIGKRDWPDPLGSAGRQVRESEIFGGGLEFPTLGSRIEYRVTDGRTLPLEDQSVDFTYSISVLEHVRDIPGTYLEMARVMKPGGAGSHLIDLRDHHHPEPLDFLRYPTGLWDRMTGSSAGWTNRLRASDHLRAIKEAGLTVVSYEPVKTDQIPPRSELHEQFRKLSDDDLATTGMILVLGKTPGGPA